MHHPVSLLTSAAGSVAALATAVMLGCGGAGAGEIHVVLDSTHARTALEVVALPFDPATLPESASDGAPADSLAHLRELTDSVRMAEQRFGEERAAINADVVAMRGRDRATREYAGAHAALSRRISQAELLRAERDSLRARRQLMARALGPAMAPARIPWTHVDSAARATGRDLVLAPAADTITMRAPPGTWWIALGRSGEHLLARTARVEVRSGARSTVRLGEP